MISTSSCEHGFDKHQVDPAFAFYWLASPRMIEYVQQRNTGSSVPTHQPERPARATIPLPPLSEQRAIAHILGTLDDKIELNRRMNATLEAMARALFKSWFVDFDPVRAKAEGRDTGLPREIADLFPDGFEESAVGEVPRGWRVGTHSRLLHEDRDGGTPSGVNRRYWQRCNHSLASHRETVRQSIAIGTEQHDLRRRS